MLQTVNSFLKNELMCILHKSVLVFALKKAGNICLNN